MITRENVEKLPIKNILALKLSYFLGKFFWYFASLIFTPYIFSRLFLDKWIESYMIVEVYRTWFHIFVLVFLIVFVFVFLSVFSFWWSVTLNCSILRVNRTWFSFFFSWLEDGVSSIPATDRSEKKLFMKYIIFTYTNQGAYPPTQILVKNFLGNMTIWAFGLFSVKKIKILGKHPFKWQFYVFKNSKFQKFWSFWSKILGFKTGKFINNRAILICWTCHHLWSTSYFKWPRII